MLNRFKSTACIFTCLLLLAAGYLGYVVADIYFNLRASDEGGKDSQFSREIGDFYVPEEEKDIINTLLIGVDSKDGTGRSDTIMLVRYNPGNQMIGLVSIPRDTKMKLPERGREKVNHAHAYGGPNYLAKTIENFLEIPIHHYVKVNMEGFKNSIDILGGVELKVEKDLYWSTPDGTDVIDLQAGKQVLDGDKALQYVRFRADSEGDIGRVKRQQKLVKATIDELLRFRSITRVSSLLREAKDNVTMTYNFQDLVRYGTSFHKIQWSEMESQVLPGKSAMINGVWYYVVEKAEAQESIRDVINKDIEQSESQPTGSRLESTGR